MNLLGCPYPIMSNPRGLLHTQSGTSQVRSDLLVLLLTNPGERVFLPGFGTSLKKLVFEPNDSTLQFKARTMIASSIAAWEPRITIQSIEVTNQISNTELNPGDTRVDKNYILGIKILFFDPENIKNVQSLVLQIPLGDN